MSLVLCWCVCSHAVHSLLSQQWPCQGLEVLAAWHIVIDRSGLWLLCCSDKSTFSQGQWGAERLCCIYRSASLSPCLLSIVFAVSLLYSFTWSYSPKTEFAPPIKQLLITLRKHCSWSSFILSVWNVIVNLAEKWFFLFFFSLIALCHHAGSYFSVFA